MGAGTGGSSWPRPGHGCLSRLRASEDSCPHPGRGCAGAGGERSTRRWAGGCRLSADPLVEHVLGEAMSQRRRMASHAPANAPCASPWLRLLPDSVPGPCTRCASGRRWRGGLRLRDRLGCGRRSLRSRPRGRDAEITLAIAPNEAEGCLTLTRPPDRPGITRLVAAEPLGAAQRNPGYDDPSGTPLPGGAYASPRFPGQRHDELGRVFPDPPSLHPGYAS